MASRHTLVIDEIRIDGPEGAAAPGKGLVTPGNVRAKGYERHVDLSWDPVGDSAVERYIVYRSADGKDFQPIGMQVRGINRYTDFYRQARSEDVLQSCRVGPRLPAICAIRGGQRLNQST